MKKIKNSLLVTGLFVISFFAIGISNAEDLWENNLNDISHYYGDSVLLINLHLDIGQDRINSDVLFQSIDLIDRMREYYDLDILDFLVKSLDIEESIDFILFELSDILNKALDQKAKLKTDLVELEQEKILCDELKKVSDENFTLSFHDLDVKSMQYNLDKSLQHEECAWVARIYFNVKTKILQQLELYYNVLEKKYTYFTLHRENIIEKYPSILYEMSKEQTQ